jgi:ABC-type sugar transport systems, permease components
MKKTNRTGFYYITPWLIGLLLFTVYPFASSLYYSFTDFNLISSPNFIGFDNYITMFQDDLFWTSLNVTFRYVFLTVPLKLVIALSVAFVLNFKLKGINFFRTAYYIPSILGGNVAIAVLWTFLFATDGLFNQFIGIFGFEAIGWFSTEWGAMTTLVILRVWQFGSAMVIFLAALQNIPAELYEAAAIDGASKVKTFLRVTLPMLTPIIFFNFVMQLVQAFQEFNGPFLITGGGPLNSTYLLPMMIYDNAFRYFRMGYASALSWVLFLIILVFTLIIFKTSSSWVHYADEEGSAK